VWESTQRYIDRGAAVPNGFLRAVPWTPERPPVDGKEGVTMTRSQPERFLAVPSAGSGSGVLVLHAWWGLNDTIKAFCTRLAQSAFVVFAPDLCHYWDTPEPLQGQ
jgi:hypothetical protein